MATYGLQIVSPSGGWPAGVAVAGIDAVAGIVDPGPGITAGEVITGNGGGPAERTGVAGSTAAIEGRGGGVARGASTGFASVPSVSFLPGDSLAPSAALALGALDAAAAGADARNSEIGFQADFASSQARSLGLRLPSATLSRMADSEKRPANCPFR